MIQDLKHICLIPYIETVGGTASFQNKFIAGMQARGVTVGHDPDEPACQALLVIGGTRRLAALWRAKKRGIPIIQRLDGMNWLHRRRYTGVRHFLRAEYGNRVLQTIRTRLATHIVYQSHFAQDWWQRKYGVEDLPHSVIHNGVNLDTYSPNGTHDRLDDVYRLLLVEGRLSGGYETGLAAGVALAERLAGHHKLPVELRVVGEVPQRIIDKTDANASVKIEWVGMLPPGEIPRIDRSAHLLFSADLNPACPNAVIEALACGLPVASFDTGALPELVTGDSGRVVPYGGDPWRLDTPDIEALAEACLPMLQQQAHFRAAARSRAEQAFSLDDMIDKYLQVITDG
jgi:glycosyltransferase involved in cell wall biosynthesis